MMNDVFAFIKENFVKVIYVMDSYNIFGDFSILDFNITLLVFGAILPIVIVTVNNWSSYNRSSSGNESIAKQKEYNRRVRERHQR